MPPKNTPKKNIKKIVLTILIFCSLNMKATGQVETFFERFYFDQEINAFSPAIEFVRSTDIAKKQKKDWTIILYIAADNDLSSFAIRNIKQMARVGSNEHFNIVVQLDIRKSTGEKITRRYYIEKEKILHLNAGDSLSQKMDSGDPQTLISCCGWAITDFPAEHYGLVLWDHGTGILDPTKGRVLRPDEHFRLNPTTNLLEVDRSIGFIDRMLDRGICWDDSTGNFLSNQKLDYALKTICKKYLNGQKFTFLGFDACLMQMLEVANIVKKHALIMVGSEESEIGYGWHYADMLEPFNHGPMTPIELTQQIVHSYGRSYERITNEYTLSALNLEIIDLLEQNVDAVARLLIKGISKQKNATVKKMIRASRNKLVCTHFDEPSYIDLHHFYSNLVANIDYAKLSNTQEETEFKVVLKQLLLDGCKLIEEISFSHTEGKKMLLSKGIAIYFPERNMHSSYKKTTFAKENQWINFLTRYLRS